MARWRTLALFFVIAYAWAWLILVPMVMFRASLPWVSVAAFGPTVVAGTETVAPVVLPILPLAKTLRNLELRARIASLPRPYTVRP